MEQGRLKDETITTFPLIDEGNFVMFPDDIGEEVVVVPLPTEGRPEEFVYTSAHAGVGDIGADPEVVGATQEIVAEMVPDDQFHFQEGLQGIAYIGDQQYFVSQPVEGVKEEFDEGLQ